LSEYKASFRSDFSFDSYKKNITNSAQGVENNINIEVMPQMLKRAKRKAHISKRGDTVTL